MFVPVDKQISIVGCPQKTSILYKLYCLKLDTNVHGIEEEDMLPAVGNLLLALVERGTR